MFYLCFRGSVFLIWKKILDQSGKLQRTLLSSREKIESGKFFGSYLEAHAFFKNGNTLECEDNRFLCLLKVNRLDKRNLSFLKT